MKYEQAYSFIINKLENGLPSFITYHDVTHTKNTIEDAIHIASKENITGEQLTLLKTAALFHDTGFLENSHPLNHEERSCSIAKQYLPQYDYTDAQIEAICKIIMATKLPQNPTDILQQILCDADLFYLGTDNYKENTEKLYKEFKKNGIVFSRTEWDLKQIEFLNTHRYFTQTALNENENIKQQHLAALKSKINSTIENHVKSHPLETLQDYFLMFIGVISAGFALKGFLVPNHFFDGGVTGMSLLLHEIYHLNLAVVIVLLNLPLIIISYFSVSKSFAYKTFASVLMLGICLYLLPEVALTSDKLLISIFGGVFLGIGVGLNMRSGAALDGIEVMALYTLKRTSFTITEIILGINILIFTIAAFKFGIETALYSILTYFAATRSIDYVVEGLQAFTGVTIISGKSDAIKYQLVNNLGRGITVYKGERGFLPGQFEVHTDCDIVFTVITRLELRKLKNLVYEVDPNAFVFASTIKEASGGIIKRRQHH